MINMEKKGREKGGGREGERYKKEEEDKSSVVTIATYHQSTGSFVDCQYNMSSLINS